MKTRNLRRLAAMAAVLVAALWAATSAGATTYNWTANMDGPQQCASHLPCDPDGTGTAYISADTAANRVCGTYYWSNVAAPVAFGHIHEGAYGQPENIGFTINIFGPSTDVNNGFPSGTSGCAIVAGTVISEMARWPGQFLATIHNKQYPGGAIRGQLGTTTLRLCDLVKLCPKPPVP
jgi:hypothetical protein